MAKNICDNIIINGGEVSIALSLLPSGHLHLYPAPENNESISTSLAKTIQEFFSLNSSVGLLRLGLSNFTESLPTSFSFWQQFVQIFITELCKNSAANDATKISDPAFPQEEINEFIAQAPFIRGIEYLNLDTAKVIWQGLITALKSEVANFNGDLSNYLSAFHSAWNTIGRVCFHLAENKRSEGLPFAFLATYTVGLSKAANTQHVPLGKALEEYAGKSKKSMLLALLLPVHRATEKSVFLKELVETGKIFKPLAWSAVDAYKFLKDIPQFEAAGVVVRVPNWWNAAKPPRPKINVTIGKNKASAVGLNALLDFNINFALPDGETLSWEELNKILNSADKLVQIKGQWIEVDNDKLTQVLSHWKTLQKKVGKEGISFGEGLRLLSGVAQQQTEGVLPTAIVEWSRVVEGDWLRSILSNLRNQDVSDNQTEALKQFLQAQLRPYQEKGVQWLWWLYNMRLGGCLADDMGLGKTIQIIALLLLIKQQNRHNTHLLVLPSSLLGNWQAEISKFAPSISIWIAHASVNRSDTKPDLAATDLVITTYGSLNRIPWLRDNPWNIVILDEAQAIKNPSAKQTHAAKLLNSKVRFVLTGTPIENRLLDLWSLFDFIAPGLLGSHNTFAKLAKKTISDQDGGARHFFAAIRRLVSPYILRRLKTDKSIISDLPDKTEMQTYCTLTKQQVGLYQQAVNELKLKLASESNRINRRGLVLSYILRFKQICNHPNQWMGHGQYQPELSGKFLRLKELCEVIADKQEKVLIFTQFREVIPAICAFLTQIFKQEGLSLHGETSIKERSKRVEEFQQEQGPPFFVLSLKAGGTGLNLTAASHVIHFDRWWNPAVENQATDRAFRIGQKQNVLVHKFICQGTIEENIDKLINSKKELSEEIVGQGNEVSLTELSDTELMNMVSLDINRALGD